MTFLTRDGWNPAQVLSVAELIVNPATNGGTPPGSLTAQDLAPALPMAPALACFHGERAVFVVLLWPYNAQEQRGILHVAGTGELPEAWRVVRAFLDSLPEVDVLTYTANPALLRLALRAGFTGSGEQGGFSVLRRPPAPRTL